MKIEQAPAFRSGVGANFFNHFNMSWRKGWDSNPRGSVNSLAVFKTAAFNRSATLPSLIHRHSRSPSIGDLPIATALLPLASKKGEGRHDDRRS
jgi:hypothetical protein